MTSCPRLVHRPRLVSRCWLVPTLTAAAVMVSVAGCGLGDGGRDPAAAGSASSAPPSATATPPSATRTPTASPTTTGDGEPPVPGTTSGTLDASNLPAAADLGRGWRTYVDPGDSEQGYAGNGAFVRARNPAEVAQGVVPLGCAGLVTPPVLPVPSHALEATFRGPGAAPGVALVLEFATPSRAAGFLGGMARIARSCPRPARRVAADDPQVVVVTPVRLDPTTVLDRRRELGYGSAPWLWAEAVVRAGRRVGLLIVASSGGAKADQPSLADLTALAGHVRSSLAE